MRQFLRLAVVAFGAATITPTFAAGTPPTVSVYDVSMLPSFSGTVAQYLPSPAGGVSGVLFTDGTEVLVSPDLAWDVSKIVKPGERLTGTGLKGRQLPLIRAYTLAGPRGKRAEDTGITMPQHAPEMVTGPDIMVHGVVAQTLYDVHGVPAGVILKDRTVVQMPSRAATRLLPQLRPGTTIFAAGPGSTGEFGTSIYAHQVGPSAAQLSSLAADDVPPPGPPPGSPGYDFIPSAASAEAR
ncbi:hypothetical protein [Acetobacter estunensis]|uniref:hypothetical protein n=1 Tax=Acetobacter estunensis TaxID=104097 RepID=UPI001C2D3895|nr:hypothetical protein [Acetobacter estunensis]MBV1836571.1 hypothetical protein [Acetobacter estunensis]